MWQLPSPGDFFFSALAKQFYFPSVFLFFFQFFLFSQCKPAPPRRPPTSIGGWQGLARPGAWRAGVTRRLDGATFSGWGANRQRRVHVGAAAPKHSVCWRAGGGKVRSCIHVNDWVKYLLLYFLEFLLLNLATRILSYELQQWFSSWTWPDLPARGDIILCIYIYLFGPRHFL